MPLRWYLQRPVNEKLRANGLSTPVTIHDTRTQGQQLISALATEANLNPGAVQSMFQAMSDFIARNVANGAVVELPGLGTIRADVKGTIVGNLPTTKNLTDIKVHVRISPAFRKNMEKYTLLQQIPKVMPAPEIQWADSSFKGADPTVGTVWGPVTTPNELPMNIPFNSLLIIKGKNLIWDAAMADEGLFVVTPTATKKISNTLITGSRGRRLIVQINGSFVADAGLIGGTAQGFDIIVKSRLQSREIRTTAYPLSLHKLSVTNPVLVAPIGMSQQSLVLERDALAQRPDQREVVPAITSPFPSEADVLHKHPPMFSASEVSKYEAQVAIDMRKLGQPEPFINPQTPYVTLCQQIHNNELSEDELEDLARRMAHRCCAERRICEEGGHRFNHDGALRRAFSHQCDCANVREIEVPITLKERVQACIEEIEPRRERRGRKS